MRNSTVPQVTWNWMCHNLLYRNSKLVTLSLVSVNWNTEQYNGQRQMASGPYHVRDKIRLAHHFTEGKLGKRNTRHSQFYVDLLTTSVHRKSLVRGQSDAVRMPRGSGPSILPRFWFISSNIYFFNKLFTPSLNPLKKWQKSERKYLWVGWGPMEAQWPEGSKIRPSAPVPHPSHVLVTVASLEAVGHEAKARVLPVAADNRQSAVAPSDGPGRNWRRPRDAIQYDFRNTP